MKYILSIISLLLFISCADDDRIQNPYLPNVAVNFQVNLNLPQFNELDFPGGSAVLRREDTGIYGTYIRNIDNTTFVAFELTDPNHKIQACSSLNVANEKATCGCSDANSYNLIFGQPEDSSLPYSLKAYRVQKQGNILTITN
ncbi:hypothetical protein [Aquimarina brevivitae]|uniref:Nitrite reductase/ring-hydroxylating ferredoxin subunit n=1 Tax=Aquimarina brevivitae TaxID=323412 RepID=A0A4Q7PIH2_9FLAO|nr:hypothetical protein [Aquimarina brevivitae]RZS99610.1 hypothetical protein EV197_0833 [Aquimarina brevivitae]